MRKLLGLGLGVLLGLLVLTTAKAQTGSGASINCSASIPYDASTNGATLLVAAPSNNRQIYICGYGLLSNGTANVKLMYGTTVSTPCDTGTTSLTPAYRFTAQTGFVDPSPYYRGMFVPSGFNLCINSSAGVAVQGVVYYSIQ